MHAFARSTVYTLLFIGSAGAIASDFVQSATSTSGLVRRTGCEANSNGPGFFCIAGGTQTDIFFQSDSSDTPLGEAESGGSAIRPGGNDVTDLIATAHAQAQTDIWVNRALARATADTNLMDIVSGKTFQLQGSEANAVAYSAYGSTLHFAGGSGFGGFATVNIKLTGSFNTQGNPFGALADLWYQFRVGDASDLPPMDDFNAGYFTGSLTDGWPEGEVNENLTVLIPISTVAPIQVTSLLVAATTATTDYNILEGAGGGDGTDLYENLGYVSAELDFYGTAVIESIVVPFGVTVLGEGGTPLPFPVIAVPEPSSWMMFVAGLGLVLVGAQHTRHRG